MLQEHSTLHVLLRKYFRFAALVPALLLIGAAALADDNNRGGNGKKPRAIEPAVKMLGSVPIPVSSFNTTKGAFSFDISYVDQADGTYYLADRSNKAVDALFAETIVTQIFPNNNHAPFAGFTPCAVHRRG
jgi:hypothetical protein